MYQRLLRSTDLESADYVKTIAPEKLNKNTNVDLLIEEQKSDTSKLGWWMTNWASECYLVRSYHDQLVDMAEDALVGMDHWQ